MTPRIPLLHRPILHTVLQSKRKIPRNLNFGAARSVLVFLLKQVLRKAEFSGPSRPCAQANLDATIKGTVVRDGFLA
jgi:hypothetical protein